LSRNADIFIFYASISSYAKLGFAVVSEKGLSFGLLLLVV